MNTVGLLAGAGLCCAFLPASAQVFQLTAGASTAFDAQGGTLLIHGVQSETTLGAGWQNGRFAAGGASTRRMGGALVTAGQQEMRLDTPTDLFEASHLFTGAGLGLRGVAGVAKGLSLFAGATSADGGTPLFRSASTGPAAVAAQYDAKLEGKPCHSVTTAILTTSISVLESVECTPRKGLALATTAGVGAGQPYLAASARYEDPRLNLRAAYLVANDQFNRSNGQLQPLPEPTGANAAVTYKLTRAVTLSALHEHLLTASADSLQPSLTSSIDEVSISYQRHQTGFSLTGLHSSFRQNFNDADSGSNVGMTAAAQRQIGPLQVSQTFIESRSQYSGADRPAQWSTLSITTASVRMNAHLRLDETVDISNGQATFAHGGELLTERNAFRVDYEMFYAPTHPDRPFQQAMVFSAELRLFRRIGVAAQSSVDALGHTVYTFSVGSQFSRHGLATDPAMRSLLSQYVVQGRVVDERGDPIEGAALLIGSQHLYTDSTGNFSYREGRASTHALTVLTDEFLHTGRFITLSAPATVSSVAERDLPSSLRIVVGRRSVTP